jgi:hypothetical protein
VPYSGVLEIILDRVQARLDGQFRDNDALDLKALGLLAVDAGALALLVATHDVINRLWWIPGIGLGVAGVLLLVTVWPRNFDVGPDWREFYDTYGNETPDVVGRHMLAELLAATERNAGGVPVKQWLFNAGFVVLALSLLGSIPVALIRP